MSTPLIVVVTALGWLALLGLCRWGAYRWFCDGPRAEPVSGLMWRCFRVYCRSMHRATYLGLQHVPDTNRPGGLIVVGNHTGPVDPMLIQAACRFDIRWMMAADQMTPHLDWFWRRQRMIPVARDGTDTAPAREAIRHVRGGGVIGIFPEGGIVRPTGEIRPFYNGVGLIIARTKAPVLLLWVCGTPQATELLPALRSRSHARVQFIDRMEFAGQRDAAQITRQLRQRLTEASGWPLSDQPVIPPQATTDPFAPSRRPLPPCASGTMST
ncbi:MAG: lysophospholipid acyltransferase family protein [Phycisphaerales bacterium]